MFQNFPLFNSHIDLAHLYWAKILQKGDWAIDATCGNGNDTLKIALFEKGPVIALDIQEEAIANTRTLLQAHLPSDALPCVHLFQQSHAEFPQLAYEHPIRLIVYNLGYLPKGNKQLTTLTESTLESLDKALELVMPGGAISITCYPGHEEGEREEQALIKKISLISVKKWNVCHHTFLNRTKSPSLILIQKQYN